MKHFVARLFVATAVVGVCGLAGAFAADTHAAPKADGKVVDSKTKNANNAHSEAPAAVPHGGAAGGSGAATSATGESLQGIMSPQMTKAITDMKACHKDGKNDQKCHDRVMKNCHAKLTKEECSQVMSHVNNDNAKKM